MRVLQIEDDSATAQSIELMLKSEGMNVFTTDLGEEGIDQARVYDYNLILLDLNLPDMSGCDVLRTLRVAKIATPIIILTGDTKIETKVKCLSGGADDYITKPFHKDELVARIHAVVRRSCGHALSVISTANLTINLDRKAVEVRGTPIHLTGKEYQCLELLSLRKGTILTKEMFLNHLYGGMDEPENKIVDVFICKLRKKIARMNEGTHYIETVWGRGYTLREFGTLQIVSDADVPLTCGSKMEQLARTLYALGASEIRNIYNSLSWNTDAVNATLTKLRKREFVSLGGKRGSYRYSLTKTGIAWLTENETQRDAA